MKYGLHKLWFTYSDDWPYTNDVLATQIGVYDSLEAAKFAKEEMEVSVLRSMHSMDYIRDLAGFMQDNYKAKVKELAEFARAEGWEKYLKEHKYHNSEDTYFELTPPKEASYAQLKEIIRITGAYFCKIVEYVDVKKSAYIKFNHSFWGTKIFKEMKADGIIEDRSPFIKGVKNKGKYFVQKPPKGRKSATIKDIELGQKKVIEHALKYIKEYFEYTFIGKTYFEDLSNSPTTLRTYVETCASIILKEEIVDSSNLKKITAKLKKQKSPKILKEGDTYYSIEFAETTPINLKEIQSFFNLLHIKPVNVFEMQTAVNGESIKSYYPEHYTF